jgi:hypothetical protein
VINDGSGDVLVFTDGYIVNQSGPVPVLKVGDTLEAVGLSGTFADGTRIRVRDTKELVGTDTSKPEVPFINGVTDQDTTISGTAEVNSVVTAKVDGVEIGKATADTEGKFTIAIAVQNAGTKLLVTATDAVGNVSEAAEVTVLDVTAPGAPVVNGVNDNDLSISGKTEPEATVTAKVNGKEIGTTKADAEGNFTINIAKQVAGAVIHVTAADASKNESTDAQVTVTDEVVTKVSVTSNVTGNHAFRNLHKFTAVSEGSRYAVYRFLLQDEKGNITLLQDYGVNSTVSWTPKLPGTYTIIVLAKDKYNNGFLSSYHEAETKLTFTVNPSKGK